VGRGANAATGTAFKEVDWTAIVANGYPAPPESVALPECAPCGSRRFRDEGAVLRCEDCGARQPDPFEA
jgi:hypothetical protein